MYEEAEYELSKEGLAKALAEVLSDTVTIHYLAHGYHWNVKGPEFTQFHDFFADIYGDAAANEDAIAENIRKLGFDAPHLLQDLIGLTSIESRHCAGDPLEMCAVLYTAQITYLGCLNNAFTVANAINSQGIANFLAERIDMTEKWIWQLGTTIGADSMSVSADLGKSKAEVPVIAIDGEELPSVVELQPIVDEEPVFVPAPVGRSVGFSVKTENELSSMLDAHNSSVTAENKQATLSMLKAVYRRGMVASGAHIAAVKRVDTFLRSIKSGQPASDTDLFPSGHPHCSRTKGSLTASGMSERELYIELRPESDYASPEEALFSMAEYSGLGYESISAFRAAWRRGVNANENPFNRASELAINLYDSRDADLLPKQESEI